MWPTRKGSKQLGLFEASALVDVLVLCIAPVLTMPLDVAKTRLMTQSGTRRQYKGLLDCLLTVAKDEGLLALFMGLGPRFVSVLLSRDLYGLLTTFVLAAEALNVLYTMLKPLDYIRRALT